MKYLQEEDPDVFNLVMEEEQRQCEHLELIASENFTSKAVREATGSILTNKYAEGYPGRRYYGGCQVVDRLESLAITRAQKLFGAEYANVQPHSGSQANMAVYFSVLSPGDLIMGMDLAHGGHLTHGAQVSFSGQLYHSVSYGVDRQTECLDMDVIEEQALRIKPKMIIAGASSYSRIIDFERFSQIAQRVGAYLLCDIAHIAGPIVTGLHPSPIPHADFVTTTTHKTLRGPRGGLILIGKDRENHSSKMSPTGKVRLLSSLVDSSVIPGIQGGPLLHVIAAKAVAFAEAASESFQLYQKQVIVNSQALAAALTQKGLRIVSGGTDNHLCMVDLQNLGLTGLEAEKKLEKVGITVNKNAIPFDPKGPLVTSGIRLGTPAMTTRGFKEEEMKKVADLIVDVLQASEDRLHVYRQEISRFAQGFPYP